MLPLYRRLLEIGAFGLLSLQGSQSTVCLQGSQSTVCLQGSQSTVVFTRFTEYCLFTRFTEYCCVYKVHRVLFVYKVHRVLLALLWVPSWGRLISTKGTSWGVCIYRSIMYTSKGHVYCQSISLVSIYCV